MWKFLRVLVWGKKLQLTLFLNYLKRFSHPDLHISVSELGFKVYILVLKSVKFFIVSLIHFNVSFNHNLLLREKLLCATKLPKQSQRVLPTTTFNTLNFRLPKSTNSPLENQIWLSKLCYMARIITCVTWFWLLRAQMDEISNSRVQCVTGNSWNLYLKSLC